MGKLTATINLESKDIWSTSVKISNSAVEQANGETDIQTVTIPGSGTRVIFGPSMAADAHNTVYFYASSAGSNKGLLKIAYNLLTVGSAPIAILRPGDFMWVPLLVNKANIELVVDNSDVADAKLDILYAYRG